MNKVSGVSHENLEAFVRAGVELHVLGQREDRYELKGWARFLSYESEVATVGRLRETYRLDCQVWAESADILRDGGSANPLERAGPAVSAASHALDDCITPVLEALVLPITGRILDVGCGDCGHLLSVLGKHPDWSGVGLDMDPSVVHIANEEARKNDLSHRMRVILGTLSDIDDQEQFDAILGLQMIYYVAPAVRMDFFQRIHELLNNGGAFILVFLTASRDPMTAQYSLLFRLSDGLWPPPASADIVSELEQVGFSQTETRSLTPGGSAVAVVAHK
ncbi:SAM-dependent methyltransferase [Streptomyces sp. NPDC059452]|uniref:SAM-dependent methyltransferase n=1 Tax=Streptomyces sp. NPDC059452 TaxID=3346835 RepID=UPI0036AC1B20